MTAGELNSFLNKCALMFLTPSHNFCSIQSFFFTCTHTKFSVCCSKYMSADNVGVSDLIECQIIVDLFREEE